MQSQKSFFTKYGVLAILLAGGLLLGVSYAIVHAFFPHGSEDETEQPAVAGPARAIQVTVVSPRTGGMDRTTTQPGSLLAFETVEVQAAVSGYLKTINVHYGSMVKKGDVLAVIEVPELDKQLQHRQAMVELAQAKVAQMRARKAATEADLDAAGAAVKRAKATADSARAWERFRKKQYERMQDLFTNFKAIDERLLEESKEQYEAAVEATRAAEESIVSSKAGEMASKAKIAQAAADIDEATANVKVAQAEFEKTQEILNYATIKAPFDGMISKRSVDPGAYIRAASAGNVPAPMLVIDRIDKLRVVVRLPDRDVPLADVGDEATVEVDAFPGQPLKGEISRIAGVEDVQTRMMRVEVDLANPTGKLKGGMYGYVTITLEKSANVLTVPGSCLVNKTDTKANVLVVRDGHAAQAGVTIVGQSGANVGVTGLKADDQVIINPAGVTIGAAVAAATKKKR